MPPPIWPDAAHPSPEFAHYLDLGAYVALDRQVELAQGPKHASMLTIKQLPPKNRWEMVLEDPF